MSRTSASQRSSALVRAAEHHSSRTRRRSEQRARTLHPSFVRRCGEGSALCVAEVPTRRGLRGVGCFCTASKTATDTYRRYVPSRASRRARRERVAAVGGHARLPTAFLALPSRAYSRAARRAESRRRHRIRCPAALADPESIIVLSKPEMHIKLLGTKNTVFVRSWSSTASKGQEAIDFNCKLVRQRAAIFVDGQGLSASAVRSHT